MRAGSFSAALFWLGALAAISGVAPPPTPAARNAAADPVAGLPWGAWFEKNTIVTDKKTYVHFLWDANAVKNRFEGKDKVAMIAEAGRQLAVLRYPPNATADAIRADIVFVTARDGYGNPLWDSLQRVAHLEFSRKALLERPPGGPDPRRGFAKFEILR